MALEDIIKLKCPECGSVLHKQNGCYSCELDHLFGISHEIVDLTSSGLSLPEIYDDDDYQKWSGISTNLLLDSYQKGSVIEKIQDYGHRFLESVSICEGFKLDLGCGFGRHYDFIEDRNKVIGFDANLESLKVAVKMNPNSFFIKGRMERLPFFDDSFEAIYSIYSLEHIYNLPDALSEIKRVLKKGGELLVGLPAEGGFLYNTLRRFSTIPYYTKKYEIDYSKVVAIEHCNTAKKVMKLLESEFQITNTRYFPLMIPSVHLNLILMASFKNIKDK